MKTQSKISRWFSKRELAQRYGVSTRSIERWSESGKFPRGVQLNRRYYWSDAAIEAHERGLVGGGEAA
jgi:predicted DNA-binding transcriptional regulator AlpA